MTAAIPRTTAPACTPTLTHADFSLPQGGALSNLPVRQHGVPPAAGAPPQRRNVFGRLNEVFHKQGSKAQLSIPGNEFTREPSLRSVPLPPTTQSALARLAGPSRAALAGKLQGLQPRPMHKLTLDRLHSTHAPEDTGTATALTQSEMRLPGIYTMLAAPAARERHGHHQEAMAQALAELKALPRADGQDFREVVARELPGLLQKAGFDASIYAARSSEVGGYGRYLLHSDPDPKERFCLQIFAFDPRQKTPIHNHPNECASYIAQGTLMERLYELPEAAAAAGHAGQVAKTQKNARPQASWAGFDPTQLQVPHSLKNHSGSVAVSVHLYRDMDGVSAGQQVAAADKFERFKPGP